MELLPRMALISQRLEHLTCASLHSVTVPVRGPYESSETAKPAL